MARFLCLINLLFYSSGAVCERLILSLAEKTFLPLPHNREVRVGDKSLIWIHQEGEQLSLLAKKEGQTFLLAGGKHYEIFIFNKEKKLQALQLNKVLKHFLGLEWSLSDKNIFQVTGTLNRLYDWIEISKVSKKFNIFYKFKALPGEGLKSQISYYFKSLFKDKPPPEIVWHKLPFVDIPQGSDFSEYEEFLHSFGLTPREDPFWLSRKPFIEIEIALVESLSSSGFSFGGKADKSLRSFPSFLAFLNFLKDSGQGKTLHHSSFTIQSGRELQVQSGGQIPFNSYNLKTEQKNVQWKAYGLRLNILPKLDQKNQIELEIKANFSEPLSFPSMDSPPPLKTQSLESKILLKNRQIIKLFHLKKQSEGRQNKNQMGFLQFFSNSFLRGENKYEVTQFVFLQAKIADQKISREEF